jgi:hypothetical protein
MEKIKTVFVQTRQTSFFFYIVYLGVFLSTYYCLTS